MAGLEAVLALRDLLGDRVEMTLVSPEREFVYRPMAVAAPFARGHAQRHRLADIANRLQVRLIPDGLERVDDPSRSAITAAGDTLAYDALVVAMGAGSEPAFARALTWTPESDAGVYGGLLGDLEEGYSKRVAFVVPDGVYWPLPAYELALMTAWDAYGMGRTMSRSRCSPMSARRSTSSGPTRPRRSQRILPRPMSACRPART